MLIERFVNLFHDEYLGAELALVHDGGIGLALTADSDGIELIELAYDLQEARFMFGHFNLHILSNGLL